MAISDVMEIGRQGMVAQQKALQTTSHNIANVNTPGYSRQRAVLEAEPQVFKKGNTLVGGGVSVNRIIRVHDDFVLKHIFDEAKHVGKLKAETQVLRDVENLLTHSGRQVGELVTNFFNSYRELSLNPEVPTLRSAVKEAGRSLATGIQKMDSTMGKLQQDLHVRIDMTLDEVNTMAAQLADLNQQIADLSMLNQFNGDLLDRRDVVLNQLSEKLGFDRITDERGMINLIIPGVGMLVQGGQANKFFTMRTPAHDEKREGLADIYLKEPAGIHLVSNTVHGELGGMLHVRDQVISRAEKHLDELAFRLSSAINDVHSQGVGVDGKGERLFFNPMLDSNGAAEKLSIHNDILQNAENIAVGTTPGAPGDNTIALQITDIQQQALMPDVSEKGMGAEIRYNINDSFNFLIGSVGQDLRRTEDLYQQQQGLMDHLGNYRESVSGVSLEEEAIQMMQYQAVYNASAKALKVGDELLQTVLSLKD